MSTSKVNSRNALAIPVPIWVKKTGQMPGLTLIAIRHITNAPVTNTFAFGIPYLQQIRSDCKTLYTCTQLLLRDKVSPAFTLHNRIQLKSLHTPQSPYINMSQHRPRMSILRFAAHTFVLILLLPFFLINGRDNVKLNKIKHDDEPPHE